MEHAPQPHDFESQGLGAMALRAMIDELFARSDAEVFRILNKYREDEDGTDTV